VETKVDFTDGISGQHSFLLVTDFATRLASFIMGQEKVDLNEAALSAWPRHCQTSRGSTATAFGNQINTTVMISPADCRKI